MRLFSKSDCFLVSGLLGLILCSNAWPQNYVESFEEYALEFSSGLPPLEDGSLRDALTSASCRVIGDGAIDLIGQVAPNNASALGNASVPAGAQGMVAFAICADGGEVSLNRTYNFEQVERGRVVQRASNELRGLEAPDENGFSFFVHRARATGQVTAFGIAWRNADGVQFQLRQFNAANEVAAQDYLRPLALQLKPQL